MQGINLAKVTAEAYEEVSDFITFFFEGTMPNSLDDIPFDYRDLAALQANSIGFKNRKALGQMVRTDGDISIGFEPASYDFAMTSGTYGTGDADGLVQIPTMWAEDTGDIGSGDTTFDVETIRPTVGAFASWADMVNYRSKRERYISTWHRVGRHGSYLVMDLGADPYQEYEGRDYCYVQDTADDSFLDNTVFAYYLQHLQTQNPGVYENTFAYVEETTELDEHNYTVRIRSYDVDLTNLSTHRVYMKVIVNNNLATGTAPRVSPELAVDTTQGFYFHPIPTQDIRALCHKIAFQQRSISSRQKRPSWSGSSSVSTRNTLTRLDVFNEDTGLWENGSNIGCDINQFQSELATPVSLRRYVRLACLAGVILSGYIVYSGDPHWSVAWAGIFSKNPVKYQQEDLDALTGGTATWALVFPLVNGFDGNSSTMSGTDDYLGNVDLSPVILCDVTESSGGGAIELSSATVVDQISPVITKMNFDFATVPYVESEPEPEPESVYDIAAYGINGSSRLYKADNIVDVWNGTDLEDLGTSPATWALTHEYVVISNTIYGIASDGKAYQYPSMQDLWDGTNAIRVLDASPVGWTRSNRMFADPISGKVFGINNAGTLLEAPTFDDLWAGTNLTDHGTSPQGWSNSNEIFIDAAGKWYGIDGTDLLLEYPDRESLWTTNAGYTNHGTSPVGWTRSNRFVFGNILIVG